MAETSTASTTLQRVPVTRATMLWADPNDGTPDSFAFPVVVSDTIEKFSQVTDHPVEEGVSISDNVRPAPDHVSVDVFVTNEPFGDQPGTDITRQNVSLDMPQAPAPVSINGVIRSRAGGNPPATINPAVDVNNAPTDYVDDAMKTFDRLRTTATLLTLVLSRGGSLPNMLLQNITRHRDRSTGTGANFTLEFRSIKFVSTQATDAPTPATPTATVEQQKGNSAPVEVKSVARWLQIWTGSTP